MFKFSDDRYKIYTNHTDTVVATSTYCGKQVRGVAKLHDSDTFNFDIGREIAIAKCNAKIAEKRAKRARNKFLEAQENLRAAADEYSSMSNYSNEAYERYREAVNDLNDLLGVR